MEGQDVQAAPKTLPGQTVTSPAAEARPRRSRVSGWALFAVFVILALLLYEIRVALLPFVFAIAIAFVMDPAIKAMQRRLSLPRWIPAVLVYLAILAILAGAGYWVAQSAAPDLMHVLANAQQVLTHFLTEFMGKKGITVAGHTYTPDQIVKEVGAALAGMLSTNLLGQVLSMAASFVFGSVLLLVLMPYFMISGPQLAAGTIWLLPPERRHSVEALLPKLIPALRRYLVGLFLVVVYTSTLGWIGFGAIFHLPHAVLLSLTVGVLELIPAAGPAISMAIVGLVAIQRASFLGTLFLMAFAIALRLSIDNLFGPLVLGQAARVHPVVIIIGFVVGAMLFGIVGLLLAVPTAVVIKTALQHYYSEPIRGRPQA
ncbi:MAG TPA: AI-2E family transporter [Stellaceae bacterium]|nr:AI-2E family transporter [Stellaceae bacterium]